MRKSSTLLKLTPVLDDNGLIVISGRLSEASISQKSKFPVILPSDHKVSLMITYDYHAYAHLGTEWVLSKLRTRYWIIRARAMIKWIKHECVTCKRLYGGPVTQRMADLPTLRCQPDAGPFSSVGVDVFGPFYVTVWRSQVKLYGCIFHVSHLEPFMWKRLTTFQLTLLSIVWFGLVTWYYWLMTTPPGARGH